MTFSNLIRLNSLIKLCFPFSPKRKEKKVGIGEILNGKIIKVCHVILPLTKLVPRFY